MQPNNPRKTGMRSLLASLCCALAITLPTIGMTQEIQPAPTTTPVESPASSIVSPPPAPAQPPATSAAPAAVPDAAPVASGAVSPETAPAAPQGIPETPQETSDAPQAMPGMAPQTIEATLPHDLSPWGMFMAADIVVKAVMVGLAFASFVTWTIWLAKAMELAAARRRATAALRRIEKAQSLEDATRVLDRRWTRRGPVAALVAAAVRETERSQDLEKEGIKERVAIALSRIEARAGRRMGTGTGLLATIGSTAPFVGLFGTVWGIMNAFIGISKSKTTNLAVVAPGIAEALLATAIGLVAAIPAVIIYNVFSRSIAGYRAQLSDASGEVLQHLSRDLDRREAQGARAAAGAHENWTPAPINIASRQARPAAE